jgi:hypothetical protein
MGSLTFNFMETRELQITSMTFDQNSTSITIHVNNPGTGKITLQSIRVNDLEYSSWSGPTSFDPGAESDITIPQSWTAGLKYRVALVASDGTLVGAFENTA